MSLPVPVNVLSDDEEDDNRGVAGKCEPKSSTIFQDDPICIDLCTPHSNLSKRKKPRLSDPAYSNPSSGSTDFPVFVIVDDTTACKTSCVPTASPFVIVETPSPPPLSTRILTHESLSVATENSFDRLINLGSDSESDKGLEGYEPDEGATLTYHASKGSGDNSKLIESIVSFGENNQRDIPELCSSLSSSLEDHSSQVYASSDLERDLFFHMDKVSESECKQKEKVVSKRVDDPVVKGRMSKEERLQMQEEKKLQREQEKLRKKAEKAEAAELRKLQKEKQKWEKGKFAQKSIVAHIDSKVVEMGSVGGHMVTRFGEKGLSFRVASNPIARSIIWSMHIPEELSQISSEQKIIPYVLLIYGDEEFCNIITSGALFSQVCEVQRQYPNHTICFLVNRLMAYINKREQCQYKNPDKYNGWKRPPIEEILAKLTTHYIGVHYRLCTDEAEVGEHVVSLTQSLASCQYRKKLTPLSVNANGSLVPKDCADRDIIKKDIWLKALVAIPKVQPRFAIAISKKYPTMRSLLNVYMDPSKSVHEKEFLLKDLPTEGLLGDDRRLGEICSKRVYRVLMAQCGDMLTDDVEDGADIFTQKTT